MKPLRLRSQLLIAALLIILGLTGSLLLFIRHTVNAEIQKSVRDGTEASVRAFESVQRQREQQLSRTAAMLADLPPLEAMMPANALTIQDASETFWKLAGSDLFVLAKPDGQVVALHVTRPGWSAANAQRDLKRSIDLGEDASWWYDDGRLYWVFLHPIISGAGRHHSAGGHPGCRLPGRFGSCAAIGHRRQQSNRIDDHRHCDRFHFTWRRRG